MISCPVCQAEHPEKTLFCGECASYLQGGNGAETDPLVTGVMTVTWTEREKVPKEERNRLQYIDLRFKERVYYK